MSHSNVMFNFYRNKKTLEVQGRAAGDVRDILEEVVNNKLLVERLTEETIVLAEHNINTAAITEEPPERTIPENITVMDDPSMQAEQDSITSDSAGVKIEIEIDKLWKAVNSIQRKFELPAKQSQTATLELELNEYKLKCAEYEEKIESLQQERASLMEAIRILSTDQNVTTQHHEPSDDC